MGKENILDTKSLLPPWETNEENTTGILFVRKDPKTQKLQIIHMSKIGDKKIEKLSPEAALKFFPHLNKADLDDEIFPPDAIGRKLTPAELEEYKADIVPYVLDKWPSSKTYYEQKQQELKTKGQITPQSLPLSLLGSTAKILDGCYHQTKGDYIEIVEDLALSEMTEFEIAKMEAHYKNQLSNLNGDKKQLIRWQAEERLNTEQEQEIARLLGVIVETEKLSRQIITKTHDLVDD